MSIWALGTWVAIIGLIAGSLAVFAWFLRDAVKLMRAKTTKQREE